MNHYNLVHKFFSDAAGSENPGCKGSSGKRTEKLETIQAGSWIFWEAQRDKKKVHFATLMDLCHLKNAGVRTNILEGQRSSLEALQFSLNRDRVRLK